MQIAGDWMCVLAARNLHWRYAVLHSAFLSRKMKVVAGESLYTNLERLIAALEKIWKRISDNVVVVDRRRLPINGNLEFSSQIPFWNPRRDSFRNPIAM